MDFNNKELIEEVLDSPAFDFFKKLKLSNMSRAERRRKEKELNRMERAVRSFTPEQVKLIDNLVVQVANQEISEFSEAVDRTVTAYLILKNENKSWEEIIEMQDEIADLLSDDCAKYKKLISMEGDINMAKKSIEKFQGKVKERAEQLVQTGVIQKEAIEMLLYEFPGLSKAMATNGYKRVESEFKKLHEEAAKKVEEEKVNKVLSECDEEMAEHLTHIFDDEKETIKRTTKAEHCVIKDKKATKKTESKKEVKADVKKEVAPDKIEIKVPVSSKDCAEISQKVANKIASKVVQNKDNITITATNNKNNIGILKGPEVECIKIGKIAEPHKSKSNLKILNWIKNVEGANGIYVVSADGVKLQEKEGTKDFKTLEDLEKYHQTELDKLNAYIDEVKEVFGMME